MKVNYLPGLMVALLSTLVFSGYAIAQDTELDGLLGSSDSMQAVEPTTAPAPKSGETAPQPVAEVELYQTIPVKADEASVPSEPSKGAARGQIEEVVVTAQRREENLQDVPISVSAYSESMIAERNISQISDVALTTPGFVISQSFGQVAPTIRGIGADRFTMSGEPGVALYVDDIYLGRPYLPQAALGNISRIEVLKGPQGTLYGRNTSGGAVKIVTRRPTDEWELSGSVQAGSYEQRIGKLSLSGPLTDSLGGRASVFVEDRKGYTYNAARDENVDAHQVESGRLSLRWRPLEWLDFDLNGDLNHQYDTGPTAYANVAVTFSGLDDRQLTPALAPFDTLLNPILALLAPGDPLLDVLAAPLLDRIGGRSSRTPRTINQDALTFTEIDSKMLSSTTTAQFGDIQVKLIGGAGDSRRDFPLDADLTDLPALTLVQGTTTGKQVSAELQASSDFAMPWGGDLRWLAGGFYYNEKASEILDFEVLSLQEILGIDSPELANLLLTAGDQLGPVPVALLQGDGVGQIFFDTSMRTESLAAFTDLQWNARDWLVLHAGGRVTRDTKTLIERTARNIDPRNSCEAESAKKSFNATTFRAGVDIPFAEDRMVYLSYTQGFKAGGYSGVSCGTGPYNPEYVGSVEAGLKSQWLDGSLQINAAAFNYKFDDIQVEKVVGFGTEVVNAASATLRGGELEIKYLPFTFLTLDGGIAYLDATYGSFFDDDPYSMADETEQDLSGNRLNKSPKWSGNLGATTTRELDSGSELSARLAWSYTGSMFYDQFNHDFAKARSYQVWNLYLSWAVPQHDVTIRGFAKNLTDELYVAGQFTASAISGGPYVYYNAPRMFGLELDFRFGG